jgi:dynein heavy chain
MDVHNRDTIAELIHSDVTKISDFDWLSQLRYYWKDDSYSAFAGLPGSIECRMINAMVLYAYEYIGNQDRLVITPLTDRCYRTLMGAIHLNLGGAPEGPAGTGKTETTKDLAKAIAIQCVVTNCSDGLDYLAMAKFFKGLASSGSWACFDEFNRIQLEVLSVIAQQIMQIQDAKMKDKKVFVFEGTELSLKRTCCPFITMNPGYAGRAELPDNLKVLFRTVAMMVPDYAMIAEIILYSKGYTTAKPLSVKIVTTYKLASEQLSSQSHYDYGMRAVIAVLRAAGNLKRQEGHLSEDVLVLRSIIDVNLPKFLSPDCPLFHGIVSDLFPGVEVAPPDRDLMYQAFQDMCSTKKLIGVDYFWGKVVQIYDMMIVRHGFMIVGDPFSGKSSSWKILSEIFSVLSDRFPDDKRWTKVHPITQNPKSITMGQLYGQFDPVSHEWTDGILAINYRNAATSRIGNPEDRKWLLFDGPVDALWIENMNTVLDDNRKLCLMSGEIIAMSDVMSMIFEPMDLLVASPATVSRCGMVYMEAERLGWKPLVSSWVNELVDIGTSSSLSAENGRFIISLFDWMVQPCLCFVRKEMIEMSPTTDSNLVMSLLNILECLFTTVTRKNGLQATGQIGDDGNKTKTAVNLPQNSGERRECIECCFFFSLMWSIGKSGDERSQKKFSTFVENLLADVNNIESNYSIVWNALQLHEWKKPNFSPEDSVANGTLMSPMPFGNDYHDFLYVMEERTWKAWSDTIASVEVPVHVSYNSIIVSNKFTAQYSFLLQLLLTGGKNVLVCGPTGTGKSVYVNDVLTSVMSHEKYRHLSLGFSAKTSANMTQDIIDGKLDKRRKGVYGPPLGQTSILFVDDLSMPEVETYGAQPPIELIRQLIDNGGWYDLKEKVWKEIVDTVIVSANGPSGGGRNNVTPRLLRHFNALCFSDFDDTTLRKIFTTIVEWHMRSFSFVAEVRIASSSLVDATVLIYNTIKQKLLPTPAKSHYTFNLRDLSRVFQGICLCRPTSLSSKDGVIKLWIHEVLRVFSDRLVDEYDKKILVHSLRETMSSSLGLSLDKCTKSLWSTAQTETSSEVLRLLLFGSLASPEGSAVYTEMNNSSELQLQIDRHLVEYNQQSRRPMNLVMFGFAIEHVVKVCRILKMPGGNALLVGVGGSGRQSVTRLASFICDSDVFQIEISKNYTVTEWREDLKTLLKGAGSGSESSTFLFSDNQIKDETFVEDISNILNGGEVPNLFQSDEIPGICESVRPFAKQIYGKAAQDMSISELYNFFVRRIQDNLHIILAFSPIGAIFRERLRKFPALINCCTINWFSQWPEDALKSVAEKFLGSVEFDSSETRNSCVYLCQKFHTDVVELSARYFVELKRRNYVTPTSYLELITAFEENLSAKRSEVSQSERRYRAGLEKLAFAAEQVNHMQKELEDLQPELIQSAAETEVLMGQIEEKMPAVVETRKTVSAEASVAQSEADIVMNQKASVEADLAEAIPALENAIAALDTIKPGDINEIKVLSKPPEKIKMVCKAVCIMLGIKPARIPDPDDPSKRLLDYWGPSQKMLAESRFIESLKEYDKDNMNTKIIAEITRDFVDHADFDPITVSKASKAAEGMCRWCHAMVIYDRVVQIVEPKREALEQAQRKLDITMEALNAKKAALKQVEDDLGYLESQLSDAKSKKADLENQAFKCDQKINRAHELLNGLGGEKERWLIFAQDLADRYKRLTGDILTASGLLAYLGPFTATFRDFQMQRWIHDVKEKGIPCSDTVSLSSTLGNPVTIRQWLIEELPSDGFSIDNAITLFNARRWSLMIDPQGQANRWIRNMESSRNLQIIKLSNPSFLRTLENSIQFGFPVLLENIGEQLDPSLEPLLQKQLFKQGGIHCIRLGDATIEYSESFRFYMTTKLRNPHYLPEVSVKVTLLNFMITAEGLQDQLLGVVVSQERHDLEEQRNALIVESAENKRKLKEIEDKILQILSASSGNILEDETAVETLKTSKVLANNISEKQAVAEQTESNINAVRQSYAPVAFSSQVLFFCITDLANIEPVYQYSLTWFSNLFVSSIKNSEKGKDVQTRLEHLSKHFTLSLYRNICRSLLEKDKLLFSFLLTTRVMQGKESIDVSELFFLLSGGSGNVDELPSNVPDWITPKIWESVCRLCHLEQYNSFREDFLSQLQSWQDIYESVSPHDCIYPGIFSDAHGIARLIALRIIRPDKVILGVQDFIAEIMSEQYVKPPAFDLQLCYNDSSATVPLIFILSAGSDPLNAIIGTSEALKVHVDTISLGQGQGPKAEALITKAKLKGTWVVLQNCHLAPSWMTTLEKICEELDPEDTHVNFRLWCTSYPSDVFPVSVLQNGVKMTKEAPKGLRANLIGSFNTYPISSDDFFFACDKQYEFHRLLFGLSFFHALIQERRLYGPLGWNIPYEFNDSDLRISAQQLLLFLDENDDIPFKALLYTAGECNYGGRVTDDKDRRTIMCILSRFYCSEFLEKDRKISASGLYTCPPDGDRDEFLKFIDKFPLATGPEVFGMHDNATLTKDRNDMNKLFDGMLSAGGGNATGSGASVSKEDISVTAAVKILEYLPNAFDIEYAQLKYPVRWDESMNTVLNQELHRFNGLLTTATVSLIDVQRAVKGVIIMSPKLDSVCTALFLNRIPVVWKTLSYPSLKPLSSYISDLLERLSFFGTWLMDRPPTVYWVSSFFFTQVLRVIFSGNYRTHFSLLKQAFLTGASQNYARLKSIPIDELTFDFEMFSTEYMEVGPESGVYTSGLYFEGAQWSKTEAVLVESLPKVLFSLAPIIHWIPIRSESIRKFKHYRCPLYKTSDRR